MVEVEYLGENKIFSPQEISAMVLIKVNSTSSNAPIYANKDSVDEGGC